MKLLNEVDLCCFAGRTKSLNRVVALCRYRVKLDDGGKVYVTQLLFFPFTVSLHTLYLFAGLFFFFVGYLEKFKDVPHEIKLGSPSQYATYISHYLSIPSKSETKVFNFCNCQGLEN